MKIEQSHWSPNEGWLPSPNAWSLGNKAQLVFAFGSASRVRSSESRELIRRHYPNAHFMGCSTSGEIVDTRVFDETIALTAVEFERTRVAVARVGIDSPLRSFDAGERLARELDPRGLRHVFVLSEGLKVNASELVRGLDSVLPAGVQLSGGCAGDGNRLETTHVWCDSDPVEPAAVALGFYGDRLQVGVATIGGWRPFGPERVITKSIQNVVYEFDGRPALALYKQYLGKYAEGLPASGLMFPLEIRVGAPGHRVLRAILAVNEEEQSITYAGDVPEGSHARFMFGRIDDLVGGTQIAAKDNMRHLGTFPPDLSILVSCNGRRYVLKQRTEEELEAVREALGPAAILTGFYSYGEIAPASTGGKSELHNETMTITSLSER
jgi:hypothetical protein